MTRKLTTIASGIFAAAFASGALAADIKIGAIYDYTGPFAGGGSKASAIGNKIAIDLINERGGVEGNKIVCISADAQSKTDVAINEAERLLNEQKVDLIMGVFQARIACRWPPRSTPPRSSSGSTPASPRRC